jgi:hypothetical protein
MKKIFIVSSISLLFISSVVQAQNIGIGTSNPQQRVDVVGKSYFRDSIGIGVSDPHAPLQLTSALANRKLVLHEQADNDHQFDGFGTLAIGFRYQVHGAAFDHIFYAGNSATTSAELLRIRGTGRIGVGVPNPSSQLANTSGNTIGSDAIGVNSKSFNWAVNDQGYIEALYNQATEDGANGLVVKIAGTGSNNTILDLSTNATQGGAAISVMSVRGNGNVGIGTNAPHALLQFSNAVVSRKIVLFESANNDNQFYGWGINAGQLRYQVGVTTSDHVFYAGTSTTTSNELVRIKGNGLVGVGTASPISQLSNTFLNIAGSEGIGINVNSITWTMNAQGYVAGLYNQSSIFGSNGLAVKIAGTTAGERILDLSTGASQDEPGVTVMSVLGNGNVNIPGLLSKGGGSFKIDHPLDPANKYLYHSFVESPDMMNIYNGNVITGNDGLITVTLPDYFEALNKEFRYQLTVIGDFAQAIIYKKINKNQFTIKTDKPNIEVSWQVTGVRHDPFAEKHRIPNTIDKPTEEKGHYLHPEAAHD